MPGDTRTNGGGGGGSPVSCPHDMTPTTTIPTTASSGSIMTTGGGRSRQHMIAGVVLSVLVLVVLHVALDTSVMEKVLEGDYYQVLAINTGLKGRAGWVGDSLWPAEEEKEENSPPLQWTIWPDEPQGPMMDVPLGHECAQKVLSDPEGTDIRYEGFAPFTRHLGIDMVYVTHWAKQEGRLSSIQEELRVMGFQGASFVLGMDKGNMTREQIDCLLWRIRKNDDEHAYWVSLASKHFAAMYDMLRRNYSTVLVLENDACTAIELDLPYPHNKSCIGDFGGPRFRNRSASAFWADFSEFTTEMPTDSWDVLFIGGCSDVEFSYARETPDRLSRHWWRAPAPRCTSSMVISRSGAEAMLATLPFTGPIDIHLGRLNMRRVEGKDKGKPPMRFMHVNPQLLGQTNEGGSARLASGRRRRRRALLYSEAAATMTMDTTTTTKAEQPPPLPRPQGDEEEEDKEKGEWGQQ